jgi:SAM-dependent methyltransferase
VVLSGHMTAEDLPILAEMIDYYRARAAEYDEWFNREGRYDHGLEANELWFLEIEKVTAALEALDIRGDVLEFAPGTGIWTSRLVAATRITAVDSSPEMIELNRARLGEKAHRITYVEADIFTWRPVQEFDAVVFGFWLSHVPGERLDSFLSVVAASLRPGGKIFFVDGRKEPTVTASNHEHPIGESQLMVRKLNDGSSYRIVKNFYEVNDLSRRLQEKGLEVEVRETDTYFIYGYGRKASLAAT